MSKLETTTDLGDGAVHDAGEVVAEAVAAEELPSQRHALTLQLAVPGLPPEEHYHYHYQDTQYG